MRAHGDAGARTLFCVTGAVMASALWISCQRPPSDRVQGYVEGEFVYVASPFGGALESLAVRRGAQVRAGEALFALERVSEKAARDEAERRLSQAHANLEDARKGKRPTEIESIKAQLKQAQSALRLSTREVVRQEGLTTVPGAAVELEVDRARSARDQDRQRVAQLQADLDTASLGSRTDQVIAAEAEVRAREAALARAEWELGQKRRRRRNQVWCSTRCIERASGCRLGGRWWSSCLLKTSRYGPSYRRSGLERYILAMTHRWPSTVSPDRFRGRSATSRRAPNTRLR